MYTRITTLLLLLAAFEAVAQVSPKVDSLQTVKVEANRKSIRKSFTATANTAVMTHRELLKAACCNLAESFETNPSIDVNFSDALTGTKQIKMLGLTSPYLMITEENIPSVRGASQAYGLSFTPGTWVESIQVTKGAGSVVNGYESISGQINTELLKPVNDIPFLLNTYGSTDSRFEANAQMSHKLSEKWSGSLFFHTDTRTAKNDMNNDGFLDNPLGRQFNLMNRYQYYNPERGWVSFITLRYLDDQKQTGQLDFDEQRDKLTTNRWGSQIDTRRLDAATKIGYVFKDMPYQSVGFQNAFSSHRQDAYFGLNTYEIGQDSFYSNLIFNSIIGNTMHKFATGINFTLDRYREIVNLADVSRTDNAVGAFFEYTYDNNDKLSLILGGRADFHNRLGFFVTPRLHLRYNPWENAVLRLSAGRGKRAANIFAENQQYFASARQIEILATNGPVYGLDAEIAWNYGISFSQKFKFFGRNADAGIDFYRTDFSRQAVADVYQSPQLLLFYNAKSYANSLQAEFNYEIMQRLDLRTAYKYYDVAARYVSGKSERPLQAKHRFFANLAYETQTDANQSQWKFDATLNWLGAQQLPNTATNPVADRLPESAAAFSTFNAQLTRVFSKQFELYFGVENLGDYRQHKAILGSQDPFGSTFDSAIVYAPVFGRMYYAGLRFKINK